MSMKSWRAFGESLSCRGSGEDIRIHRLAGVHGTDGALRDVLQYLGGVGNPLAPVELVVALPNCGLPSGNAAFLGLHAPDRVADYLGGVAIEAALNLALDETLHLRRQIDVHGHGRCS